MLKHLLLATLRRLWRQKLYSLISAVSLVIGLTIFSLVFLHVKHEFSYNKNWPDSNQIYRLINYQENLQTTDVLSQSEHPELLNDFLAGSHDGLTLVHQGLSPMLNTSLSDVDGDDRRFSLLTADSHFNDVFEVKVLSGDMNKVFQQPGLLAIDEEVAMSWFGETRDVIGKVVTLEKNTTIRSSSVANGISVTTETGEPVSFEIGAVFRLPEPVTIETNFRVLTLNSDYLYPLMTERFSLLTNVWLKLSDSADFSSVSAELQAFVDQHVEPRTAFMSQEVLDLDQEFRLEALEEIYFGENLSFAFSAGDQAQVLTFAAIGSLILLVGCSNAISLGLASALEQRRQIGIRKAVGALGNNILIEYLGQALALTLLAMVPAFILVRLLHPAFVNFLAVRALPLPGPVEYLSLLGIAVFVGLAVGCYPALVLSRLKPVKVLKPEAERSKVSVFNFRTVLVSLQFICAITLLIITLSLYIQLLLTRVQDKGFDPDNVVWGAFAFDTVPVNVEGLVEQLENTTGITAAAYSSTDLSLSGSAGVDTELLQTRNDDAGTSVKNNYVYPGFFNLQKINFLAGRDFDAVRDARVVTPAGEASDDTPAVAQRVIINRTAMKALGHEEPQDVLNQLFYTRSDNIFSGEEMIQSYEVIGVVNDNMYFDLRQRPVAEIYNLRAGTPTTIMLRYDESLEDIIQQVFTDVWQQATGTELNNIIYAEEIVNRVFEQEKREGQLLLLSASMIMLLASIGLYGLVSVAMKAQIKEVGIRKVLGCSAPGIILLFLKRYTWPILAANLIAWPLAVYLVQRWIERFPYQLETFWLIPVCLFTGVLVLVITWLAVGVLTYRAASSKPVNALRYE